MQAVRLLSPAPDQESGRKWPDFASDGVTAVCIDRNGLVAEDNAASVRAADADARSLVEDVSLALTVEPARVLIVRPYGDVQIRVNNVGGAGAGAGAGSVAALSMTGWRTAMAVNVGRAFYMSKAFWPDLVMLRHDVLINTASIVGFMCDMNSVAYSSVKAAPVGLAKY